MIPSEILSVNREINWKLVALKEFLRITTPWILSCWFFIELHIFSYLYLLIGIMMMSKSNTIKEVIHDKSKNVITFRIKDRLLVYLSAIVSVVFFVFSLYIKFFTKSEISDEENEFGYSYIQIFLAIKAIRTKTTAKVITKGIFLLLLTFLSIIARKSKYIFNYPNLRAAKKISKTLLFPLKVSIFLFLVYMAYGGKVSILSMVYRTAFVFILIQSLKQASLKNKLKIQTTGYIRFMHVLTQFFLIFFAMVVMLFRSLNQSNGDISGVDSTTNMFIKDLRDRYAEKAGKALLQVRLLAAIIFYFLINTFIFMKNLVILIKKHEQDMLSEMLLDSYKIDNKRITEISEDSYFRHYFTKNIFEIFTIRRMGAVKKKNLKFRNKFLEKLYKSSEIIKIDLKKYKDQKREEMRQWESLKFSLIRFIKGLIFSAVYKVIKNVKLYLYVLVNILIYISITTHLETTIFQAAVLFWVLLSYIVLDKKILIKTAVFLVFPIYIVDGILRNSWEIFAFVMGKKDEINSNVAFVKIGMFLSLIFYIFMLILETKKKKLRSRFKRFFKRKIPKKAKKQANFVNLVSNLLLIVATNLMRNFRFVALLIGLIASLVTVNILNAGLLFLTLMFLWRTKYDAKYWIYYVYYAIFFLPLLYATRLLPKGYSTFNIEIISIVGVYGGTDEAYINRISIHFLNASTASIYYWCVLKLETIEKKEISSVIKNKKINLLFAKVYEISQRMFNSYMIWIFHAFLNILLFIDKYDFMSLLVFGAELIILPIHINIWLKKTNTKKYKIIYKSWKIIYWLVNILVIWRYVLFFARYSSFKSFLEKIFLITGKTISNFILRDERTQNLEKLYIDFSEEIFLLILNFLTLISFQRNCDIKKSNQEENEPKELETDRRLTIENLKLDAKDGKEEKIPRKNHMLYILVMMNGSIVMNIYVVSFIYRNINPIKVIAGFFPILFLNIILVSIMKVLERFKFREILKYSLKYFNNKFVVSVLPSNLSENKNLSFGGDMDQIDNLLYSGQMIKSIESKIVALGGKMFPVFFYSIWIYIATMKIYLVYHYTNPDMETHGAFANFLKRLILGQKKWTNEEVLKTMRVELLNSQGIVCMLLVFLLVMHYYDHLKENVELASDDTIDLIVKTMVAKMKFYTTRDDNSIDLSKRQSAEGDFILAYKDRNEKIGSTLEELKIFLDKNQAKDFSCKRISGVESTLNKCSPNPERSVAYMTEGTCSKLRILYYNQNVQKFSYVSVLNALGFIMKRISVIPLLIPLDYSHNFMNLLYLLATFLFSIKPKSTIESSIKVYIPIFSFLMFFQLMGDYLVRYFISRMEDESGTQNGIEAFSWKILKLVAESDPSTRGSVYRSFAMAAFVFGVSFTLLCAKYSYYYLFKLVETEKTKKFYQFKKLKTKKKSEKNDKKIEGKKIKDDDKKSEEKESNELLEIDYLRWKKTPFKFFHSIHKLCMISMVSVFETGLVLYAMSNQKASFIVLMMFVVFTSNIVQKLRGKSERNLIKTINFIVYLMIIFLFCRSLIWQFLSVDYLFNIIKKLKLPLITQTGVTQGSYFVLFLSLCTRDALAMDDLFNTKERINEESNLKDKLASICYLYDRNDLKLYNRTTIMMLNDNLQNQVKQFLDKKKSAKYYKINTDYYKTDVRKDLKNIRMNLLKKYFGKMQILKIKFFEWFYGALETSSNSYRTQDPLYLLGIVIQKNSSLMKKNQQFNLEDYLCGDFKKAEHIINTITNFYIGLNNQEKKNMDYYKEQINHFKDETEDIIHSKMLFKKQNISRVSSFILARRMRKKRKLKIEKKEKSKLQSAANILFDYITDEDQAIELKEENQDEENETINFKLKDNTKVIFHNIKQNFIKETKGNTEFSLKTILKKLTSFIDTNAYQIISIYIIFEQMVTGGVLNFVISGIIFFFVFIDTTGIGVLPWDILNIIFFIQMCCKFMLKGNAFIKFQDNSSTFGMYFSRFGDFCNFLFGGFDYIGDAFCQLLIIWIKILLKRQGYEIKGKYMLDNPSTAAARHIVNLTFDDPYYRETNNQKQKLMCLLPKIMEDSPLRRTGDCCEEKIKLDHIKALVKFQRAVDSKDVFFLTNIKKLILTTRNDVFRLDKNRIKSGVWRNISKMQRKKGTDMLFLIIIGLLISIVCLFMGYSRVSPEPVWFFNSFLEDDLKDDLWLHAMIFLTFAAFQLFFVSAKSMDKVGLKTKPLFFDCIDQAILAKKKETIFERPIIRFRKVAKRVIALLRTFKPRAPEKMSTELLRNPIFRLLICQMLFWCYLNYLIYFRLVSKGHTSKLNRGFFEKYKCFYNKNLSCHPSKSYFWTKVIQFSGTLWTMMGILQIKYGLPKWSSNIIEFNLLNKLKFYAKNFTPFIREIFVISRFAANKTSLTVMHWLTINDVVFVMQKAKFLQVSKEKQKFGVKQPWLLKIIIGIIITLFFLLVVIGPLLPFSNFFHAQDVHEIIASKVVIGVRSNTNIDLGLLFKSELMLESVALPRSDPKWTFLNETKFWKSSSHNLLKRVSMSSYSQTFHDFMLDQDGDQSLNRFLDGGTIYIDITFDTDESRYPVRYKIPIKSTHSTEIKNIIQTNCASITLNREMFLKNIPVVYELKNKEILPLNELDVATEVYKKWSLGVKCSYYNQTYFYISNEKEKSLTFVIKSKNKRRVTDFFAKTLGIKLNILIIYVFFFRYVGITVIRKITFGKTTEIWYNEMPRPEVLFVLIDAIDMARMQMDYLKEDILYYYLVQLLRNPEDLHELTGSMLKHRLKVFHRQELEESKKKRERSKKEQ